ncbi:MAG: shikimate dehydrogenase [Planctomycetes bacterium]|nr:shikimate dehydrogenase [Planctomycetota bacterium]
MALPKAPAICAVIGRTRHKMVQVEIQEAAKRGARLLEIRLDYLAKAPDFHRLLARRPCPMIATVRRQADGGRWPGHEEERQMLLRQAIVAGFDWVDLETDVADDIRRYGNVKRIISYHNFREVPEDLEKIFRRMCEQDADVVKVAVTASSPSDNLRVMKLVNSGPKPTVAVCMGDLGTCSRVLIGRLGSPFSYATFNKERSFAPGIFSFEDMKRIYRFEQLRPDTKVFGVIGDPVSHSLSPRIHNGAFAKLGINAVYLPFRVPRGELAKFLEEFEQVPVAGYSVTIPHKEAAARLAQVRDPEVERIGAANTLIRTPGGWHAYNTDAPAALASLQANLPQIPGGPPTYLSSRKVLLLGAGGVARAVAFALNQQRCELTIANRTLERAHALGDEVGGRVIDWTERNKVECDTLINCTPIGMHPNLDDTPVHELFLNPGIMVFDTIYTPETTMLIREAREKGCPTLTGVDMFIRQAAMQFYLFTGMEAPTELMAKLVKRALSPVRLEEED